MAKQLAILVLVLSCITVSLSLQCWKKLPGDKEPKNETCHDTKVEVCYYEYQSDASVNLELVEQGCAILPSANKKKDTCDKGGAVKKTAYCGTDLCNTKALYDKLCGGGQSGLKSSIFAFGSIIICLFSLQSQFST